LTVFKEQEVKRKTLDLIEYVPTPNELYEKLMQSDGWKYSTNQEVFLIRDRALVATLYLGDFRASEVLPLTTENFEDMPNYLWVKGVRVSKTKKVKYREAKFPKVGERSKFTDLVLEYLKLLAPKQRLFPWSLKKKKYMLKSTYVIKSGEVKHRFSYRMIGTYRAWQIVNALLPDYTQHWLRAFGYNFDYDNMGHDVMAVSDKTKADPRSLQPYLRRRYDKYPVR
jgi:hypothetical protein